MTARPLLRLALVFSMLSGCAQEEDAAHAAPCDDDAACADVAAQVQVTRASYQQFSLQTGTPIPRLQSTDDFVFLLAANRDVFAIKKRRTGTGSTEVHVLSAASNYQRYVVQTGTPLPESDYDFQFGLTSNRDLVAIKTQQTGSGKMEVHILSAASGYRAFALQVATPMDQFVFERNFVFKIGRNDDLVAIKTSATTSNNLEVHVLSAANNYQTFSVRTQTAPLSGFADFEVDRSSNDLFAIYSDRDRPNFQPRAVRVVELSAASGYAIRAETTTPLKEFASIIDYTLAPNLDLFAIKKYLTGTGSVEVHVLAR